MDCDDNSSHNAVSIGSYRRRVVKLSTYSTLGFSGFTSSLRKFLDTRKVVYVTVGQEVHPARLNLPYLDRHPSSTIGTR
jgi:hypothetical protein